QVNAHNIISKLFFDVAEESSLPLDPETLQNELDKVKAQLLVKEKELTEDKKAMVALRDSLGKKAAQVEVAHKQLQESEDTCVALQKQMKIFEKQNADAKAAKAELHRLRTKMQSMERLESFLSAQGEEVQALVRDVGKGAFAVEHLSIYCISMKREYDKLKENLKLVVEEKDRMQRERLSFQSRLQRVSAKLEQTEEQLKVTTEDVQQADKEILSLKKKVDFLQKTLSSPCRANEAIIRLIQESPAPLELRRPERGQFVHLDPDGFYSPDTPEPPPQPGTSAGGPAKRKHADGLAEKLPFISPSLIKLRTADLEGWSHGPAGDENDSEDDIKMSHFLKTSTLFKKRSYVGTPKGCSTKGSVRTGFDGMGGRTKFIEPTNVTEIRPVLVPIKKKVGRPPGGLARCPHKITVPENQPKLDVFLQ
uniref:TRAF-interacting protein n=1 Tax=Petromyzon marinus TaxID=7757 RepID=S4R7Z5_PETMA